MGKLLPQSITDFSRGMTNDLRVTDTRFASLVKNFDAYTKLHALTPFRSTESGNDNTGRQLAKFLFANSLIYALGIGSSGSGTFATLWSKSSLTDAAWIAMSSDPSSDPTATDLFHEYHDLIYGASNGTKIWTQNYAGAFTSSAHALSYTTITQAITHSKDDCMYFGYDNKIARNNAGSWTDAVLTLGTNRIVTRVVEFGNYLAIITRHKYGGRSRAFLWDLDGGIATVIGIDLGEGDAIVGEELGGYLVTISKANANSLNQKLIFKKWISGPSARTFREIISSTTTVPELIDIQKDADKLYFMASITLEGVLHNGVWAIRQSADGSDFVLALDRPPQSTALTAGVLKGFIAVGDYIFQAFTTGGIWNVSKTDDQTTYTIPSRYESLKFNGGNASLTKDLHGVSLTFEPLPSGAQLILYYRIDADTAWTTLFTFTTANALTKSAVRTATAALKQHKEVQFALESTGGAVPTGIYFTQEITGKATYE